jgi:titin
MGRVSLAADGSFTYTPDAGFHGVDSFSYSASDGAISSPGIATINVTDVAPVANADAYSALLGQTLHVAAAGVLGHDTDADHDPLSAILQTDTSNGALMLNANGSFDFRAYFAGSTSFSYEAGDGALNSSPANAAINVTQGSDTYDYSAGAVAFVVTLTDTSGTSKTSAHQHPNPGRHPRRRCR